MDDILLNFNNIRMEISFKSFEELRRILSFYQRNNLNKINIPCKNNLKKDFLLQSIKIAKDEFPSIDLVPHFSILHEFRKNRQNTQDSFIKFLRIVKHLGCKQVLLVSGSQKRTTLDSVSALSFLEANPVSHGNDLSIGVAFNPYMPAVLFDEEIYRLEKKLESGLVGSIWLQFGTDNNLLQSRIKVLKNMIDKIMKKKINKSKIKLFGSILIPSKQFLARFKYRPWKGVYCSTQFLNSLEFANSVVKDIFLIYEQNRIYPVIETIILSDEHLKTIKKNFLNK
tara:strand:- start:833 stop:1681 length:849 start_codon:yes stop_codon:yes gene_type:complete